MGQELDIPMEIQGVPHMQESHCLSELLGSQVVPQQAPGNSNLPPSVLGVPNMSLLVSDVPSLPPLPEPSLVPATGCQAAGRSTEASRRGRRARREPCQKLYDVQEPFDDPVQEKKRQDAINSKKNRERKKKEMEDLRRRVEEAKNRRDTLRKEVAALRIREAELMARLRSQPATLQPSDTTTTFQVDHLPYSTFL